MITITVDKRGKRVLLDVPHHISRHRDGMRNALAEIGQEVVNETKRLITTGARTGRIYRFRGRPHQASAPGEVPANRSGKLADSGGYRVKSHSEMVVGEEAPYAGYLENGTRGRMAPRPHLITAINNKARDTEQALLRNGVAGIKYK